MSDHTPFFPENLEDYAPWVATHGLVAPYGECQCRCGGNTVIADRSDKIWGHRYRHPKRFIIGHATATVRPELNNQSSDDDCKVREIALTQGKVAIVDAADWESLSKFRWHAHTVRGGVWYAVRKVRLPNGKYGSAWMHRDILDVAADVQVDHRDGDGLNNTRENLRPATNQQNLYNAGIRSDNKSGYKGVSWSKYMGKWRAYCTANGKTNHIGYFDSLEDAARAYDEAAIRTHGEFARLNFEVSCGRSE